MTFRLKKRGRDMARKRGRTYGARAFTRAEDDLIRSAIKTNTPMAQLAKLLNRSRSGVYARRVKVAAQLIMDFDHDSAGE